MTNDDELNKWIGSVLKDYVPPTEEELEQQRKEHEEHFRGYGTPESRLLKIIRANGFNPIAITILICEETFVFQTEVEAHAAAASCNANEGWWYGLDGKYPWAETLKEYRKRFNHSDKPTPVYDLKTGEII